MQIKTNKKVALVYNKYPDFVKFKIAIIRNLIIESAKEINEINELEETLKWNEPSFLTKIGSTIRIDWKPKKPDQYAIYFKCTSRLVETFKIVFTNKFNFEGNRAIIFKLHEEIPIKELKCCIKVALTYHKVKHLPTLGI